MSDPGGLDLTHVDYSALTEPLTHAQVRAWRATVKQQRRADPTIQTGLTTATSIVSVVCLVFFAAVFGIVLIAVIAAAISSGLPSGGWGFVLFFVAAFVGLAILIVVKHFGSGGNWATWRRLTQFAQANGLQFSTRSPNPSYPGMIFALGDDRSEYNHLSSTTGRFFDLGSYQYSTGSGRSRATHNWGFLALKLDRQLPNMVLDSKENNTLFGSDLPIRFSRDQVLSLEGDFDNHFTLYCPEEYQTDALYVFTPDLMALLIDDAGSYDVEIVDDWMFIYSPHPFPPLSVPTYQRLLTIVQTVGNKTVSQTENYHDDRVGSATANIVAPEGQRLRHGTSIGALVITGAFAAFWLYSVFHGLT
jgi:hypothetical protein